MDDGKLVPAKEKINTVRQLILANKDQIQMALPRAMNPDRFARIVLTCISTTPMLLECSPRSLLGAVIQAAQLGLEPGLLGQAYLVPFRDRKRGTVEVQLIPGYKGLLKLARNSGEISTIQAFAVYRDDEFEYGLGTNPHIRHKSTSDETAQQRPDDIIYVYSFARLKDGGLQFDRPMTRRKIDQHRDQYAKAAKEGPWVTNYEEMALKTSLRQLCKMLPAATDHLQVAVSLDERAEAQLPQNLGGLLELPEPASGTALDILTTQLEQAGLQGGSLAAP